MTAPSETTLDHRERLIVTLPQARAAAHRGGRIPDTDADTSHIGVVVA